MRICFVPVWIAVLLAVTLILSAITFSIPRTTMLEGAVHLSLFFVFLVLIFSPRLPETL